MSVKTVLVAHQSARVREVVAALAEHDGICAGRQRIRAAWAMEDVDKK
jgi:hypothetical protein